jgi:hypothetical protein
MPQFEPVRSYDADAGRLKNLIGALERSMAMLTSDVQQEERKTGVFEIESPCYSILARQLRSRRDNIASTVTVLAERLRGVAPPEFAQAAE